MWAGVAIGVLLVAWGNALVLVADGREEVTLVGQVLFVGLALAAARRARVEIPWQPVPWWAVGTVLLAAAVAAFLCEPLPVVRLVVATALGEEALFRGVLFGVWRGRRGAVAANAVFFALWHVAGADSLVAVLVPGVGALAFLYARIRWRSVLAPAVAHVGVNLPAWVVTKCW